VICILISCAHYAYERTTSNQLEEIADAYSENDEYFDKLNVVPQEAKSEETKKNVVNDIRNDIYFLEKGKKYKTNSNKWKRKLKSFSN
jgi:hypothetical protein